MARLSFCTWSLLLLVASCAENWKSVAAMYTRATVKGVDEVALQCLDSNGEAVEVGATYIPDAMEPCVRCTCSEVGFAVMCKSVLCSPQPSCSHYQLVPGQCCKFHCLDPPDLNYTMNGAGGGTTGSGDDKNTATLGVRLVSSTVTCLLVFTLLLFIIHRLRQRKLFITLRRMDSFSREETIDYMSHYDQVDIEFPPYDEPPPPYTGRQSPIHPLPPGEAPPPYAQEHTEHQLHPHQHPSNTRHTVNTSISGVTDPMNGVLSCGVSELQISNGGLQPASTSNTCKELATCTTPDITCQNVEIQRSACDMAVPRHSASVAPQAAVKHQCCCQCHCTSSCSRADRHGQEQARCTRHSVHQTDSSTMTTDISSYIERTSSAVNNEQESAPPPSLSVVDTNHLCVDSISMQRLSPLGSSTTDVTSVIAPAIQDENDDSTSSSDDSEVKCRSLLSLTTSSDCSDVEYDGDVAVSWMPASIQPAHTQLQARVNTRVLPNDALYPSSSSKCNVAPNAVYGDNSGHKPLPVSLHSSTEGLSSSNTNSSTTCAGTTHLCRSSVERSPPDGCSNRGSNHRKPTRRRNRSLPKVTPSSSNHIDANTDISNSTSTPKLSCVSAASPRCSQTEVCDKTNRENRTTVHGNNVEMPNYVAAVSNEIAHCTRPRDRICYRDVESVCFDVDTTPVVARSDEAVRVPNINAPNACAMLGRKKIHVRRSRSSDRYKQYGFVDGPSASDNARQSDGVITSSKHTKRKQSQQRSSSLEEARNKHRHAAYRHRRTKSGDITGTHICDNSGESSPENVRGRANSGCSSKTNSTGTRNHRNGSHENKKRNVNTGARHEDYAHRREHRHKKRGARSPQNSQPNANSAAETELVCSL